MQTRVWNQDARRGAAPALLLLLALGLLLAACTGAAGESRSNPGNPRVTDAGPRADAGPRDAPTKPAQPAGETPSTATEPGAVGGTLAASDLAVVYQFILERHVDRVDHAALIQRANAAIREAELTAGALPLDTAPLDLAADPLGDPRQDFQSFARAYDAVVQKRPGWAAATRPDWAALRQMLAGLGDNHSVFIEPDELQRMNESGYSGIGVRMSKPSQPEAPVVVEVFQNSPASRAGLRAGDRVTAVDGVPTAGRSLTEIVSGIRGAQGSALALSVARGDQPARDVTLTRAPVEAPRVEGIIRGNVVGVLRIRGFGEGVPEAVQQVLTQGQARGARAWVLDLRGNTGGALNAVARVAANWVDNRPVGVAVDRAGSREPITAEGRPAIPRTPLVVLIDKETASGAEILAASIKEYGIAPLVGATTAGSVGIAVPRPLPDGSAVQITIRRLVSPSGAPLDKIGVQPDFPVELTIADLERGNDPQLDRALELLVGRIQ